jgi:hypothetical protein
MAIFANGMTWEPAPQLIDEMYDVEMRCDLSAAREKWIAEAETAAETKRRKESDFLKYRNAAGAFADFHSNLGR